METTSSSPVGGLFVICSAMFMGAFLAGMSCYKLNRRQLAWLNCFAAGLLLGTALGVIVPEGVRSIYEGGGGHGESEGAHGDAGHVNEDSHGHAHSSSEGGSLHPEQLIGWTLILGFLTMMVADDIFASCTGGNMHGHSHDGAESLDDSVIQSLSKANKSGGDVESDESKTNAHDKHEVVSVERRRTTVTLGLLIHNAMDGLAMGAAKAALASSTATQTVVFWAIMMHHVPASFGYATYLRNSGMEEKTVRKYVAVFSVAAPLSAALTFFTLHPHYLGAFVVSQTTVGSCLLFSAGTFLNVACVHALEEAKRGFPRWGLKQALVLCLGACVPGIASWNHEH